MGIGMPISVQKMTDNPLTQKLKNHRVILASGSPRRKKFFEELGLTFEIRISNVEETYPKHLKGAQISDYLAILKASPLKANLKSNEILVTSDTVVWHENESLAKASNSAQAIQMLQKLSGKWHEVITSVCFTTSTVQKTVHQITKVKFMEFTHDEMAYYIDTYKPFDKAGAYGIQEWLGTIGIEEIKGSYTNVVGLPTHLVYKTLIAMVS